MMVNSFSAAAGFLYVSSWASAQRLGNPIRYRMLAKEFIHLAARLVVLDPAMEQKLIEWLTDQ